MLILIVSPNEDRLYRLQVAVQAAGFRTISARGLDQAWARTDFFDFGGVVIDYELKNDIAASAFRQRFITLNLNDDANPDAVGIELSSMFGRCSELVQYEFTNKTMKFTGQDRSVNLQKWKMKSSFSQFVWR